MTKVAELEFWEWRKFVTAAEDLGESKIDYVTVYVDLNYDAEFEPSFYFSVADLVETVSLSDGLERAIFSIERSPESPYVKNISLGFVPVDTEEAKKLSLYFPEVILTEIQDEADAGIAYHTMTWVADEVSKLLGRESFVVEKTASGTNFDDRIIVGSGVTSVFTGPGNDVIVSNSEEPDLVLDGGRGDDLYVLGGGNGDSDIDDCLIFDLGGGSVGSDDRVLLHGFGANSQIVDLGDGRIEVFDSDGDVAILEVRTPEGATVGFKTISDSLIFADESGVTRVGEGSGTFMFAVEDVFSSDALAEFLSEANSERSDTFLLDESVVAQFDAGGGEDVITVDLTEAAGAQSYRFDVGTGDDLIIVDTRGGEAGMVEIAGIDAADTVVLWNDGVSDPEIEECLIFDLTAGGVEQRPIAPEVLLPNFTASTTEVRSSGAGIYQFIDTSTGKVAEIAHQYDNGDPLSLADVMAVYSDEFMFV